MTRKTTAYTRRRAMEILQWNRAQADPPITITKEWWLSNQLERFYTSPQQPLTEAQYIAALGPLRNEIVCSDGTLRRIVRAIEAARGTGSKP